MKILRSKYHILVSLALLAVIAGQSKADMTNGSGYSGGTARETRISGYYAGAGGEFTVYDTSTTNLLLSNSAYSSLASDRGGYSGSFQTFCMETDEYTSSPMQIFVSLSNVNGSAGSHAWGGGSNTNSGDDLDSKTAWLYTQFATGNLDGYAYSGTVNGLTRSQTAASLQWLIWTTEEESGSTVNDLSLNSTQLALVKNWNDLYSQSNWTGIGNVRVLQNCNLDGGAAQDFLYLNPVPVPGAFVLGMLGLMFAGKKLRKYA